MNSTLKKLTIFVFIVGIAVLIFTFGVLTKRPMTDENISYILTAGFVGGFDIVFPIILWILDWTYNKPKS